MALRILVKPAEDYFVAFLATRGINITSEKPDVVYYFEDSKRKLKKLVKEHNPDLVVIGNKKAFDLDYKFPYVQDEMRNDNDIYIPKQVNTNAPELARLHYQSLGLERLIYDCGVKEKKEKVKLQINSSTVKRIFSAMMWD